MFQLGSNVLAGLLNSARMDSDDDIVNAVFECLRAGIPAKVLEVAAISKV